MATNNEAILIEKIKNGHTQAFAEVVEAHKNMVFSLGLRMLKNREEAEEVSQDTFIKVYRSLNSFKGDSKFSTWIYRIAYNTCLDRLKKEKKKFLEQQLDEVHQDKIHTLQNALDQMILKEREEIIKSCLQYLQPEDAALLTLFYFEENSLKELEKILKLPTNTIKVRLHRARKKFGSLLVKHIEPEILKSYG